MYKRLVVTGSLAYDHIMNTPASFSDQILPNKIPSLDVSFIVKKFRREFGGTGGNIAYNLSLLKIPTLLISSAGQDFLRYRHHLEQFETLDISGLKIYKNDMTASGFVMIDKNDNQIWSFFEGAMKHARKRTIKSKVKEHDFLIIAPDDPLAMIRYAQQARRLKIDYMFDPASSIPNLPVADLKETCMNSKILIGNDYEISLILQRIGWSLPELFKNVGIVITTMGKDGSVISDHGKILKIKASRPTKHDNIQTTGAGDAYKAGFMAGYFMGKTLRTCGQMGSVAAAYSIEKPGTQTHKFSLNDFVKRYKRSYKRTLRFS